MLQSASSKTCKMTLIKGIVFNLKVLSIMLHFQIINMEGRMIETNHTTKMKPEILNKLWIHLHRSASVTSSLIIPQMLIKHLLSFRDRPSLEDNLEGKLQTAWMEYERRQLFHTQVMARPQLFLNTANKLHLLQDSKQEHRLEEPILVSLTVPHSIAIVLWEVSIIVSFNLLILNFSYFKFMLLKT